MFHRHSSLPIESDSYNIRLCFEIDSLIFWASLLSGNHIDYTINPCRLCVLQNTLGGKPLISRSANTCVFLLSIPLMLQAFQHNSGLSPLQRITLCQCVWHHTWLVVLGVNYFMVIAVVNHYQFRVQVSLTILPVPRPYIMLKHVFTSHWCQSFHSLELFHTKTSNVKFSDNCGFRYAFHRFFLCAHNLLRAHL